MMEEYDAEQVDSLEKRKKAFLDVLECNTCEEALVKLDLAGVAAGEVLKKWIAFYFDAKHGNGTDMHS